jgi:hypothetical protein
MPKMHINEENIEDNKVDNFLNKSATQLSMNTAFLKRKTLQSNNSEQYSVNNTINRKLTKYI